MSDGNGVNSGDGAAKQKNPFEALGYKSAESQSADNPFAKLGYTQAEGEGTQKKSPVQDEPQGPSSDQGWKNLRLVNGLAYSENPQAHLIDTDRRIASYVEQFGTSKTPEEKLAELQAQRQDIVNKQNEAPPQAPGMQPMAPADAEPQVDPSSPELAQSLADLDTEIEKLQGDMAARARLQKALVERSKRADEVLKPLQPDLSALVEDAQEDLQKRAEETRVATRSVNEGLADGYVGGLSPMPSGGGGPIALPFGKLLRKRATQDAAYAALPFSAVARDYIGQNEDAVESNIRNSEFFKLERARKEKEFMKTYMEALDYNTGGMISIQDYVAGRMEKWERNYIAGQKDELETEIVSRMREQQMLDASEPRKQRFLDAYHGNGDGQAAMALLRNDPTFLQRDIDREVKQNAVAPLVADFETKYAVEAERFATDMQNRIRAGELTVAAAQQRLQEFSEQFWSDAQDVVDKAAADEYERQIAGAQTRIADLMETEGGKDALLYYQKALGLSYQEAQEKRARLLTDSYESLGAANRVALQITNGATETVAGMIDNIGRFGLAEAIVLNEKIWGLKKIDLAAASAGMRSITEASETPAYEGEFSMASLRDPEWWEKKVAHAVGTSAPGIVAGVAVTPAMGLTAGSMVMTGMEALSEGGFAYREALAQGKRPEDAAYAARKTAILNMGLLSLDRLQLGMALGISGQNRAFWKTLGLGAGAEGTQEMLQEAISQYSIHGPAFDPVAFLADPATREAFAIGSIIGGGFQAPGGVAAAQREMAIRANYDTSAAALTGMLIADGEIDLQGRVDGVLNLIEILEKRGQIDASEATRAREGLARAQELVEQIPSELSEPQKRQAAKILLQINALETEAGSDGAIKRLKESFKSMKEAKPEEVAASIARGMGFSGYTDVAKIAVVKWIDQTSQKYLELLDLRLPPHVRESVQATIIRLADTRKAVSGKIQEFYAQQEAQAPSVQTQEREDVQTEEGQERVLSAERAAAEARTDDAPTRERGLRQDVNRLRRMFPTVNFVVVKDREGMVAAARKRDVAEEDLEVMETSRGQIGGYYDGGDFVIVNLDEAKDTDAWHEAIHPMLSKMAATPEGRAVVKSLEAGWRGSPVAAKVRDHLKAYRGETQEVQDNEALTETLALLAKEATADTGRGAMARHWIQGFLTRMIGRPVTIDLTKPLSIQDLVKSLDKAYRQQREVVISDVQGDARPRVAPRMDDTGSFARRNEENPEVQRIEREYKEANGFEVTEPQIVARLDKGLAMEMADAYEDAVDATTSEEVQAAYRALADETRKQWDFISAQGYTMRPWLKEGQPYNNSVAMMQDVRENKNLYFFLTEEGFGQEGDAVDQRHALLQPSGVTVDGKPLVYNDLFRAVHDFFGHAGFGNQFGPIGEENAWRIHSQMFSPLARKAMTSETRGQNSWVNFGPQMRGEDGQLLKRGDEGWLPAWDREYAPQKNFLFPDQYVELEDVPQERREGGGRFSRDFDPFVEGTGKIPWHFKKGMGIEGGKKDNKAGGKNYEAAVKKLGRELVKEYERAAAYPEVQSAIGWYENVRQKLFYLYGGFIDPFGRLLAAVSPRQNVRQNFAQAEQLMQNMARGEYDELLNRLHKYVLKQQRELAKLKEDGPLSQAAINDFGKSIRDWAKDNPAWIYDANGNKTQPGVNGAAALLALYGGWGKLSTGPKTRNFFENLVGYSYRATIDSWAARTTRRVMYGNMLKQERWAIPMSQEGKVNDADFYFAREAFGYAADKVGLPADDFQALMWFYEKIMYGEMGLSDEVDLGSFENHIDEELDRVFFGASTMRDALAYANGEKVQPPGVFIPQIREKLQADDQIKMLRLEETAGEYMGTVERAFDLQMVVPPGHDVSRAVGIMADVSARTDQDDLFVSTQVDVDHPNARPAVEVLISDNKAMKLTPFNLLGTGEMTPVASAIIEAFNEAEIYGHTVQMDNGRPVAISMQFVPELTDGVTTAEQAQQAADAWVERAEQVIERLKKSPAVRQVNRIAVNTQVFANQEYGAAEQLAKQHHETSLAEEVGRRRSLKQRNEEASEGRTSGSFSRRQPSKLSPEQRQVRSALRKLIDANGGVLPADVDELRKQFPTVDVAEELLKVGDYNRRKTDSNLRAAKIFPSDTRVTTGEKAALRHSLRRQVKASLEGWRQGRKEIKDFQEEVKEWFTINADILRRIHPRLKASVGKRITEASTPRTAELAIEALEKSLRSAIEADQAVRKSAVIEWFKKNLDPKNHKRKSKTGTVRTGGLDADTIEQLPKIAAIANTPYEKAQDRIAQIQSDIDARIQNAIAKGKDPDFGPTADEAFELFSLQFAGLEKMSAEDAEAAKEVMNQYLKLGRKVWQKQEEERKERDRKARKEVIESIFGAPIDQIDFTTEANRRSAALKTASLVVPNKLPGGMAINDLTWHHQSWISFGELLGVKEGKGWFGSAVHKHLVLPTIRATERQKTLEREWQAEVLDAMYDIFGVQGISAARKNSADAKDRTFQWVDDSGRQKTLVMTTAQARKKWMETQDPTLDETFEKMGYDGSIMEMLERELSPEDLAFARWQLEFYQRKHAPINKVYRQMFGVNMGNPENYSPIRKRGSARSDDTALDRAQNLMSGGRYAMMTQVWGKSLKERVKNVAPLQYVSDVEMLNDHIQDQTRFVAWAPTVRSVTKIITSNDFRDAVTQTYGEKVYNKTKEHWGTLSLNFIPEPGIPLINYFRRAVVTATLSVKPVLMLKQISSFVAYASQMPAGVWASYYLDPRKWKRMVKGGRDIARLSEYMKSRGVAFERDLRSFQEAMSGQGGVGSYVLQRVVNSLMLPTRYGDRAAIYLGGIPVYNYWLDRTGDPDIAIEKFEMATRMAQQSSDMIDLDLVQKGGQMGKLLTTYMTSPLQYMRMVNIATHRMRNQRGRSTGEKLEDVKIFTMFYAILPVLYTTISVGLPLNYLSAWLFGDDEPDQEELKNMGRDIAYAAATGVLNAPIILGPSLDFLGDSIANRPWVTRGHSFMPAFEELSNTLIRLHYARVELMKIRKEEEVDGRKLLEALAGVTSVFTGLPMATGTTLAMDMFEKDKATSYYFMRLMGYSDYVADVYERSKKKIGSARPPREPSPQGPPEPRAPLEP